MKIKSKPTPEKGTKASGLKEYFRRNPGKAILILFLAISGTIGLLAILLPDLVWDQFIWKYYWGPLVADAEDRSIGEIREGYNIISTITYGIILTIAVFIIYRLILVLEIELDKWFFLAIIPYILFGGFVRALEDAMLFKIPVVYFVIAPVIYVFTGIFATGLMVFSHYTSRKGCIIKNMISGKRAVCKDRSNILLPFCIGIAAVNLIMLLIIFNPGWNNYSILPVVPMVVSFALIAKIHYFPKRYKLKEVPWTLIFGMYGIVILSYPASLVAAWYTSPSDWQSIYLAASGKDFVTFRPDAIAIVIGLSLMATFIWAALTKFISSKPGWKGAAVFGSGVNLAFVFGQFTDASATFIAIDYYGYWEKHVVPSFLIEIIDTAAVMFVLKIVALVFAIYVLDISLRKELEDYPQVTALIKLAVLVLGLAPGTRDMLRLAMGV